MENRTVDSITPSAPTATNALRLGSSLLQERPVLLLPPLGMLMLTSLLLGAAPSPVTFLSVGLLNLAVTGGWYRMIILAARHEPSRWEDFLAGVGRHFYALVAGSLVFFCAMMAWVLPLMLLGFRWAGDLRKFPLQTIQAQIQHGNYQIDPQWLTMATRWSLLALLALLLYAALSYFLLLWNQLVVVRTTHWIAAWRESVRMTIAYWKPLCAILTVNGFAWLVAFLLRMAGNQFVFAVLASFASLVAEIYFRTAFTAFTHLAVEAADNQG